MLLVTLIICLVNETTICTKFASFPTGISFAKATLVTFSSFETIVLRETILLETSINYMIVLATVST